MYPYFTLWGHKLYSVGIGIVVSVIVFLVTARYHTRKQKLPFSKLFYWLPTLLITCYLLGNWAGLALDVGRWFPFRSIATFAAWLSPYGYHFHFVGLMIGAAFAWRRFFKKIYLKSETYKRVNVFFFSFAFALIPMGLFLLLGDTFIGNTTDAWYGVVALLNDSLWINFGRVFPLGIIVSIIGFISYGSMILCKKFIKSEKVWGYLGFSIIFFCYTILFLGQHYPRHGVIQILGHTLDIKNYISCAVSIYFLRCFLSTPKKKI